MLKYSVIIPTFNRCYRLMEAIDSVLEQDYYNLEIIVIDDGSTDDTNVMVAEKFPEVRYVFQKNRGPAAARNIGLQRATGDIIAFLDSDDIWHQGKIRRELTLFEQYPEAEVLAGNAIGYIDSEVCSPDIFAQRKIPFQQQSPRFFHWSLAIMRLGPVCNTSGMTFKASVFEKMQSPAFDETLRMDEDWDLEFRLFNRCEVLLYPCKVCSVRVFNDGTRQFYSPKGQPKSPEERIRIWQQQKQIISRYLVTPTWTRQTRQSFTARCHQLEELINEAKQAR